MAHHKLSILCIILLFQCLFFIDSYAQCSIRIDYKIEPDSKGSSILHVKSLEGANQVKIQLYDLNLGKVVSEKEIQITRTYQAMFTEVKSSLYVLYVWLPGCAKPVTIGGEKYGILIEN